MKYMPWIAIVIAVLGCGTSTIHMPIINRIMLTPDSISINGYSDSVYVVKRGVLGQRVVELLKNKYRGRCSVSETIKGKFLIEEDNRKRYENSEMIRIEPIDTLDRRNSYLMLDLYYSSYDRKWHLRLVENEYYFFGPPD